MKNKKGFTIIELMLSIGIIMGLGVLELQRIKKESEALDARRAGEEMKTLSDALTEFAKNNAISLQSMGHPSCAVVAADVCKIDWNALVLANLLPSASAAFNSAIKSNMTGYIRRVAPSGGASSTAQYNLEVLVKTDAPWTWSGNPMASDFAYTKLNAAAKAIGPAGGVSNGQVTGLYGAWTVPYINYPGLSDGLLVARTDVQAQALSAYLPLNGSLAMTGPLNMGNYRVNDVKDIQLMGPSTLQRSKQISSLANNWVFKGAYTVSDTSSVPKPVCPDGAQTGGVPKVLVKMSYLGDERYGGHYGGYNFGGWWSSYNNSNAAGTTEVAARAGWNVYALDNGASWTAYVRRYYDGGFQPGQGVAEVYCYYP